MITLPKSPVVFDEASHTYRLGGKMLSGVTSLIHEVCQLGIYPDANDFVKEVAIPRAGHYGTCVHHAIQTLDELGLYRTDFPVVEKETRHYGVQHFGPHNVEQELKAYEKNKADFGAVALANEYTVSDEKQFASQIDNIWLKGEEIWLVDTKTNNIKYYPGGEPSLRMYLSWQLSVYAYMFEKQTGHKVAGLACNWFHNDESAFWLIERVDDSLIEKLLNNTTIAPKSNGYGFTYTYFGDVFELLNSCTAVEVEEVQNDALITTEAIDIIANLLEAEKKAKGLKEQLKKLMKENGVKKWSCDRFTATIGEDCQTRSLDTKKLMAEHPEIDFSQYQKVSHRSGSLTIKLK